MDELKIRLVKVAVCVIATAGQHRVGKAVCQQSFQPHGEIQVIQIFQEAVLPGVAQFFQIIGQIVLRNHLAHGTDLLCEGDAGFSLHLEAVADGFQYGLLVGGFHLPELRLLGAITPWVCIRHVKDVLEPGLVAGVIQQGNAPAAPVYPAIHPTVPKLNGGAGGGIGTLGVDQKLIPEGVLINPGGSF
ncbi:hypothetical protein [Flavonifractor plautii]|uniref:hypothetical protein n=1 Tax=Flavonifractor plautii TaxID=292800 RepID=UPI000463E17C|nr:hypothetical protein [Flavonifractor plautii]MDB7920657.1 hypothetical protein [Flavonifractor plautii]MDB7944522.1 hypothetical protein [Flavonifractor plautii]